MVSFNLKRWLPALLLACCAPAWGGDGAPFHATEADLLELPCEQPGKLPEHVDSRQWTRPWTRITLPHALVQPAAPACRVRWLRLHLDAMQPGTGALTLYMARLKVDGLIAVYGDGRLLHQARTQGPVWNANRTPLWVHLGEAGSGQALPREILLRIESMAQRFEALSTVWVGPEDALRWRFQLRTLLQTELPALCGVTMPVVGLFSLFIWFKRRREWRYLIYAFIAILSSVRGLLFFLGHPIGDDMPTWLRINSLFWLITASHYFIRDLHRQPQRWLTRGLLGLTALVSLLTLPPLGLVDRSIVTPNLLSLLLLLAGGTVTVAGLHASWRQVPQGVLVATCFGLGVVLGIGDGLMQSNLIGMEGVFPGSYSMTLSFFSCTYIMFRQYLGAIGEVERSHATLAQRLAQREGELEESFQRLLRVEELSTLSRERQRMMQDMHDGIGSSLRSALWAVEKGQHDDVAIADVLKDCIDDLKLAIDSMEPVEADLLLLLAALRFRLGSRLENSGIKLIWGVHDIPALDWLTPVNALHILRILQEAFTNIIKHANASEVLVRTGVEGGGVIVTIADNGRGFTTPVQAPGRGKGLGNQRHRAQAIGGKIGWNTSPGGTCLTLWLPLRQAA
ncbi:MAG: ATP-binding protein [Pseudomonadota bacterium]